MRLTSDRANGDVYQSVHTLNADNFSRSRSYSSRPCCAFRLSLSAARSILFARRRLAFHRGGPNGLRRACGAISTIANIESEQVWRRAVVFVIVGVPLWPLAMFWDGVRLRGGETEPGGCRPQRWCRCARAWDASGARQGRQANTTTCTAPFGLRPTTELRHGGDSAPGRAASARRWVPQLFFRQPQSSGGDKGALTAVRRCSEG